MNEAIEQWNAEVVPRNTHRQRSNSARKPGGAKPFKRASALYMQALDLKAKHANDLLTLQLLINGLPAYGSRGHGHVFGRSAPRTNFHRSRSKYQPHQGKSEAARRVFQAMPHSQRALARRIGDELFGEIGAMVTSEMSIGGAK